MKLKQKVLFIITFIITLNIISTNKIYAVGTPPYLEISPESLLEATHIAKQQDLSKLMNKKYLDDPTKTIYSGIGRIVYNSDEVIGTGFVIGDHTFLTSAHVVDVKDSSKRYQSMDVSKMIFEPSLQNGKSKYKFHPSKISFIPGTDIAVVNTKEKMTSSYIRKLEIGTKGDIDTLKSGDRINIAGYPDVDGFGYPEELYWSRGLYLMNTDNIAFQKESTFSFVIISSAYTFKGNSGSPIMNSNYKVIGVHSKGATQGEFKDYSFAAASLIYFNERQSILSKTY